MTPDLRIPIGWMFSLGGLILTAYGVTTSNDLVLYTKSLGLNVNLWWGLALLAFGLVMFVAGQRAQDRRKKDLEAPLQKGRLRRG